MRIQLPMTFGSRGVLVLSLPSPRRGVGHIFPRRNTLNGAVAPPRRAEMRGGMEQCRSSNRKENTTT
jgi:hypothetical protein